MINIVIPMAGEGSRFINAGYTVPKPFIEIEGKSLIEIVLNNLKIEKAKYILLARTEHLNSQTKIVDRIKNSFNVEFVKVDKLTEGSAMTVLYAHKLINNETPLLIANSDQYVDFDVNEFIDDSNKRNLDGSILTFTDKNNDPKWSFARTDNDGIVTEVKEKEVISDKATVGLYYFVKGSIYVNSALDMIVRNDKVNNEYYTCPVYNYAIMEGRKFGIYNIPFENMYGLGTPNDLNYYIKAKI